MKLSVFYYCQVFTLFKIKPIIIIIIIIIIATGQEIVRENKNSSRSDKDLRGMHFVSGKIDICLEREASGN